jgi:hypothetical protein
LQSFFSQSRQRSNGTAKLQDQHSCSGLCKALAMAIHGVQPPGNLYSEGGRQGMLHQGATGHRRGTVFLSQFGQPCAEGNQISIKKVESFPDL